MVASSYDEERSRIPPKELGLGDQLLYRVASLDAAVQQGFRRTDEGLERLRSDFHEAQLATNDRINNLDKEMHEQFALKRARIDNLVDKGQITRTEIEKRITALETWKAVLLGKLAIAVTIIMAVYVVIAPTIRNLLGIGEG